MEDYVFLTPLLKGIPTFVLQLGGRPNESFNFTCFGCDWQLTFENDDEIWLEQLNKSSSQQKFEYEFSGGVTAAGYWDDAKKKKLYKNDGPYENDTCHFYLRCDFGVDQSLGKPMNMTLVEETLDDAKFQLEYARSNAFGVCPFLALKCKWLLLIHEDGKMLLTLLETMHNTLPVKIKYEFSGGLSAAGTAIYGSANMENKLILQNDGPYDKFTCSFVLTNGDTVNRWKIIIPEIASEFAKLRAENAKLCNENKAMQSIIEQNEIRNQLTTEIDNLTASLRDKTATLNTKTESKTSLFDENIVTDTVNSTATSCSDPNVEEFVIVPHYEL